jgi:DNA invertase Pin-like site-specific DNA recombinase
MKPAVIYAAKSTEDKRDSIGTQLDDCRAMAEREGWEHRSEWEFQDEAFSAYHGDRGPGLVAARELAEALAAERGGKCVLVAQHSDRFARGDGLQATHLAEFWFAVRRQGIELRTVQDDSTFTNPLLIMALGERNTEDSRRKGLAVQAGLRRRVVQRHQFVGGRRPFGYRWAPELDANGNPIERDGRLVKRLEPCPEEAAVVRRIFAEYVEGAPQNQIARGLMHDGVATLTPGGSWYATTVAVMLRNPTYSGRVVLDGQDYPGDHEPIIDTKTWDVARQLRAARQANGRPRGRRTAGRHLLTEGLLRCPCGAPMSPVTKRDARAANGFGYETYACVKRLHHGPGTCAQPPIKRTAIDDALWSYFADVALDLDATRDALTEQATERLGQLAALRQQTGAELARAEARLSRITRGWQDEVIDDGEYARQRAEVVAERDAAQAQADQHERQREAVEAAMAQFDAKAVMREELARLRQTIAGEAEAASREGLQAFRVALRRLFAGFELIPLDGPPHQWFGTGQFSGQVWQGDGPPAVAHDGATYALLPYVRDGAMKPLRDTDPDEWPALQRVALSLSDNLCARLAAW